MYVIIPTVRRPNISTSFFQKHLGSGRPLWRSIGLSLVAFAVFSTTKTGVAHAEDRGVPPTSQVLPLTYVENLFLKSFLWSYGRTDQEKIAILKDAEKRAQEFAFSKRSIERIDSVAQLEKYKKHYFPDFLSLADEMDFRKTRPTPVWTIVSTNNPDVTAELEQMMRKREQLYTGNNRALPALLGTANAEKMMRSYGLKLINDPANAKAAMAKISDQQRLQVTQMVHSQVDTALAMIDSVGKAISSSKEIKLPTPGLQRFFEIALGEYFQGLPLSNKLNLIAAIADRPEARTDFERFEIMVMNSGPQFQKMLQGAARTEGFGDSLGRVFQRLEASAKAVPWRHVKAKIDATKVPFTWVKVEERPLGVGTMAQVHRAVIELPQGQGQRQVVVRILKPGILDRIREDNQALEKIAAKIDADPSVRAEGFPKMTPLLKQLEAMAALEGDMNLTIRNQKTGAEVYTRDVKIGKAGFFGGGQTQLQFRVPGVFDLGRNAEIMVQEFVGGSKPESFASFAKKSPDTARAAAEELAKLWLETALLEGGFYHSDLHQGNLLISHGQKGEMIFNLLDFGMAGHLNESLQNRFLVYGLVSSSNDPGLIARALWELSDIPANTMNRQNLEALLKAEMEARARIAQPIPFYEYVTIAGNNGIQFPNDFVSLNRGTIFVFQMLMSQKSPMDFSDAIRSLLSRRPMRVASILRSSPSISSWQLSKALVQQLRSPPAKMDPMNRPSMCSALFMTPAAR